MKNSNVLPLVLCAALAVAGSTYAQRTQSVGDQPQARTNGPAASGVATPKPAPAPASVNVKYEGGLIGYQKADGTLSFDDANRRLVFRDKKNNREVFSVPYDIVDAAWPDTKAQRSAAGSVIASTVPYGLGLPALLWKKSKRYIALQYRDPDTNAQGIASFKMENKEILASVLNSFAEKAGLTQRGEAFVRRRDPKDATTTGSTGNP
ncbi:MAG TPA: hypothetical protein VM934_15460 [Pyrinomonadaceae bacterium]|jgi:hypothetical protein|nr:hypothetical protein [Pyrinomonadaceae bacterium]